jgi:hypothetical protein
LIDNLLKAALPEFVCLFLHRFSPSSRAGSGFCPSEMVSEAVHMPQSL